MHLVTRIQISTHALVLKFGIFINQHVFMPDMERPFASQEDEEFRRLE